MRDSSIWEATYYHLFLTRLSAALAPPAPPKPTRAAQLSGALNLFMYDILQSIMYSDGAFVPSVCHYKNIELKI